MKGRATAPAKYANLIFLLNMPLDVVRIGRLPVCLFVRLILKERLVDPYILLTKFRSSGKKCMRVVHGAMRTNTSFDVPWFAVATNFF
jgi:hypothetical protein